MGEARRIHFIVGKKGWREKKENRHRLACCNHVRSIIQLFHQQSEVNLFRLFSWFDSGCWIWSFMFGNKNTRVPFYIGVPPTFKISLYSKYR